MKKKSKIILGVALLLLDVIFVVGFNIHFIERSAKGLLLTLNIFAVPSWILFLYALRKKEKIVPGSISKNRLKHPSKRVAKKSRKKRK